MKFLHAADLHLDTPFGGLTDLPANAQQRLVAAPLVALTRLVDLAIAQRVDFVLLVGDLFDTQGQSVQAQATLMAQLDRLNQVQIPVLLSFGNHDFQADLSRWHFPENVYVFGPQVTTVTLTTNQQERVAVSGFSYDQRWIESAVVAGYPVRDPQADYHLGTLHGQRGVAGDHYAPFRVSDLVAKHYDYWALGHIHQRQSLNSDPPIEYSGNIQGRNRSETGAKGCLIVTSQADHRLKPEFYPLTDIVWQDWQPRATATTTTALVQQLAQQLTTAFTSGLHLVTITLPGDLELTPPTELAFNQGALLGQLREVATDAWWPVDLQRAPLPVSSSLFGLNAATWQATGQHVVTPARVAELADHLLTEDFLNRALLETTTAEQWQAQVMRLLTDQYHLTTGGTDDVD